MKNITTTIFFFIFKRENQGNVKDTMVFVDCVLYSGGNVHCVPTSGHSGLCIADLRKYPYDMQTCEVVYGSWMHNGEVISFKLDDPPIAISDYIKGGEWELLNVTSKLDEGRYDCCPESTYPSIKFTFTIKRHAATIAATYIVPAIGKRFEPNKSF